MGVNALRSVEKWPDSHALIVRDRSKSALLRLQHLAAVWLVAAATGRCCDWSLLLLPCAHVMSCQLRASVCAKADTCRSPARLLQSCH
jgi:hypothetical protein